MKKIITTTMKNCHVPLNVNDTVVASIPESESFLRVIKIPVMSEIEINESVQWEVAQHIPFGLEHVYIDWEWIGERSRQKDGEQEVLVGATEKKVVDPLYQLLQSLNLDVAALELEGQAIVRALISKELMQTEGLLIVDLGGATTNIIIHDRGTTRFTASLRKGEFQLIKVLTPEEAEPITGAPKAINPDHLESITTKLQPGLDEIVVVVRGIVDFYTSQNKSHAINSVLLTGGGSRLAGLDKAFLRHFDNIHVQQGNPWVNILPPNKQATPPLSPFESVHYSTALGLALRPVIR